MKLRKVWGLLTSFALILGQLWLAGGAVAQSNLIGLDFAAVEPTTYVHATGIGGGWNDGNVNTNIERSLEGESFKCNDFVSYVTKIDVPNVIDLQKWGAMTLNLSYRIDMDTTGKSGVALGDPVIVEINSPDSANKQTGSVPSTATVIASSQTGAMFSKGAELLKTVQVTGVEAGETIIIRMNMKLYCQSGSSPTGNLQVRLSSGSLVAINGGTPVIPADTLNTGDKTVDLKNLQNVALPSITLNKTVTTADSACPGTGPITIYPTQQVKYCYVVSNTSSAPLYNITSISDDNGIYPDFTVPLTGANGLTDIDGDGIADDLAAGASATAFYLVTLDGSQDSTHVNIATVSGYDKPSGGNQYTASGTATVYIDVPGTAISIVKLTNGSDGPTVLVGDPVSWTYAVSNIGTVELSNVYVLDDQGVTVTCPKSTLAIAESMTCTASGTAVAGVYVNTGTAYGTFLETTVNSSDVSSYFGADPKIDIQKTPDSQVVVEGQTGTFNIKVTNTGNIGLTNVTVTDPLSANCEKVIGDLAAGAMYEYTCTSPTITANLTNVASVKGSYGGKDYTAQDSASITVDYLPNIEVTKVADPTTVPETGGEITFTFSVKNKAPENFTLTSLTDDKFGDLNGQGTCSVPQTIAAGATYACTIKATLSSDLLKPHTNVVTATGNDPEKHVTSGTDDATVTFSDVLPNIKVTKSVVPTAIKSSGDYVDYTIRIDNLSLEAVKITNLVDSAIALSDECKNLIGQTIAPKGYLQCGVHLLMYLAPGTTFTNTVTAYGEDNDGNQTSSSGSAILKSFWYGRTPGFWKNHPASWPSPYLPTTLVSSVFSGVSVLNGTTLDLNGDKQADTLMSALAYKGGSTLQGGAQILLRAAVAALLNEDYYGVDYPAESSTSALILHVNTILLTKDRAQYIALASYYDYWNNGVEGPKP